MSAREPPTLPAPQSSQRDEITIDKTVVVTSGQEVEVFNKDTKEKYGTAIVVFIGLEADRDGTVPAVVRLDNPDYKLRCEMPVQVRFTGVRNDNAIQQQEKKIADRDQERKKNEMKKKETPK